MESTIPGGDKRTHPMSLQSYTDTCRTCFHAYILIPAWICYLDSNFSLPREYTAFPQHTHGTLFTSMNTCNDCSHIAVRSMIEKDFSQFEPSTKEKAAREANIPSALETEYGYN